jgi:hypothetical protein
MRTMLRIGLAAATTAFALVGCRHDETAVGTAQLTSATVTTPPTIVEIPVVTLIGVPGPADTREDRPSSPMSDIPAQRLPPPNPSSADLERDTTIPSVAQPPQPPANNAVSVPETSSASFPETTFGPMPRQQQSFPETSFGPPPPPLNGFPESTFGRDGGR